jgi:tetratricopeptide (TPR) repeat protein
MIAPSLKHCVAMTDFFISYTQADRPWAEWIDQVLRAASYTTKIQVLDFRPGQNFVVEMHRAAAGSDRTIAVLSPDYLLSLYAMAEWAAAFAADPDGTKGKLVPVLVREAELNGLLAAIIHIRLVGLQEAPAREALLKGLAPGQARSEAVRFPGAHLFPGPRTPPPDPEAALSALAALPVDEVPMPGPLPAGSRMPLAANPLFVGREEDLKTLARQLKAGETSAVGQVETAAATGLGGIGKTQLASEFAHRYGRYFAGGVFWMSFADASAVPAEVAACGTSLGLHLSFETLTLEQQVRLVLEAWKSPLPRLLIFDNCEEEEPLRRWRPSFGGSRALLTSRRSEWDLSLGIRTIPLTTLARPASIELLRRFRPDVPEADSVLDGIAAELGDLPLALHLAGSFLREYRSSPFGQPAAYLEQLRKKDLLDHPSLQGRGSGLLPTGHEAHVGRTFALSFERLDPEKTTDAMAVDLLARAAWFAPGESIPRSLLLKTVDVDSGDLTKGLDTEDALRRLTDLGLIESSDQNGLLMHRLVAAWAQSVAKGYEALGAVEKAVLEEASRLNEGGNPAPLLAWQPHLRVVAERANQRADMAAARLYDELGFHLWQAGDYSGARPYLEKAAALHAEVSGPEHPDTAKSLNIFGRILHSQGDFPAALSCYERGLAIREKTLEPEHPDIAQSLNDIGTLLDDKGQYEEARASHERALAIQEKVLGPEHPDTARSLSNLGSLFQVQGDYRVARPYHERALAIWEKVLGPEHPDTARSLSNLGSILGDQGDSGGARLYFERALAIKEKVLGPEHPSTATSLNNLADLLQTQGDLKGARSYLERALAIHETVLGVDHPATGKSLANLGSLYSNQGNFARARLYLERALPILKTRLGPDHPDTKETRWRLSMLPGARHTKKQPSKKER